MIKKNFIYKGGLANKLSSIGAGLFVVCLCLLSGSCDSNIFPGDEDSGGTAPVALQFSTSVEKLLSTADTRAINPNGGILEGSTFPEGNSEIGMFITKNSFGNGEVFPGSNGMKAVLTRDASGRESWTYPSNVKPEGNVGTPIKMVAYWPYNQAATASGIPFDFRDVTGEVQKELLYNKKEKQVVKIPAEGKIPLQFAHAYSRISLHICKSSNSGEVKVSSASISNQTGKWIKNQGMINPATGYPTQDSKPGDITDATTKTLTLYTTGAAQYDFLVPAFMNESVLDGDIAFKLNVAGKETLYSLQREHLNKSVDKGITSYGFQQGYKNSYILVYDNLTASLQLRDWNTVEIEGGNIGEPLIPDASYQGWVFDYNQISQELVNNLSRPIKNHLYETYLSDSERGNNGTNGAIWLDNKDSKSNFEWIWSQEPPRSPIEFALFDATSYPVQWRDESKRLIAKEFCKNYREGGYSNWRLPRTSEWYMFERRIKTENDYLYFSQKKGGQIPGQYWYWSGTQSGSTNIPHSILLIISPNDIHIEGAPLPASNRAMVRCVRDVDSGTTN